eukprot:TRINITY_DN13128_c0_g1_i1.p1 TRINITY_DN13128_c0_g1~~TRINITY_DN13128_c0_g1_i1.p1  ORF type:complete len:348 (-),score=49.25 TRINITY_DN13128_c0_g1_i1:110-1153(-)
MPRNQLEGMLVKELGEQWEAKVGRFEFTPFASASIGQVHLAEHAGREIAMKIQYPGVASSIDADLATLKALFRYTSIFPRESFIDALVANIRSELIAECDYVVEAEKQERFRELLANDSRFAVPKVIRELSTKRILSTEMMQGMSIDEVSEKADQAVRDRVGSAIMDLTLREIFLYRYMQTDPNPSNFLYDPKTDRVVLLDFGAARDYSHSFIDLYFQIVRAGARRDRETCLRASREIGFLSGEENRLMTNTHVDSIMIVAEPFAHPGLFDFGSQTMTNRIYKAIPIMLRNRLRPPPPEIYSLHRKLSGAYLMAMKLRSRIDCNLIFSAIENQYVPFIPKTETPNSL